MGRSSINESPVAIRPWQFWIDVGGTFTDCLAKSPDGNLHQAKVLSSGFFKGWCELDSGQWRIEPAAGDQFWAGATIHILDQDGHRVHTAKVASYDSKTGHVSFADQAEIDGLSGRFAYELVYGVPAPVLAMRRILKLSPQFELPDCHVHLGTTRGTNALLTRSGARTAFVTTKGFRDLLRIGDQARPHLFELTIRKPKPLFEAAIEIDERVLADGTIEQVPQADDVRKQLHELRSAGIDSVAICLMHGFRFPEHEQLVGEIAREMDFKDVRLSSEVAPLIKILARGETTVLDAYLNPVLGNYLDEIQRSLTTGSRLQLMTSAGGLVNRGQFSGKDSVLSGPAGGIVGAARVAEQAGFTRALTFDMGGTSSDVGRYEGEIELEYETRKSGVRIMTPMVAIETVAAGGGSICRFDGTKLVVGPQSAASDPGPVCYGRGGPLAVTDVNLFLGRVVKDRFPFPLDEQAVERRLQVICREMGEAGFKISPHELAAGFLAIANQNMASAIRSVSIAHGYDPREYLLVAFGGAGPQHCCAVAELIGIQSVLDHPQGSILSAVGIRLADQTSNLARSVLRPLGDEALSQVQELWNEMEGKVTEELGSNIQITRSIDLRYEGTESCQTISDSDSGDLESKFKQVHQQLFGFNSNRPLEIVAARVEGRSIGSRLENTLAVGPTSVRESNVSQPMWQSGPSGLVEVMTPVFDRGDLCTADKVLGPAIVAGELSTTIVDSGWAAVVLADGQLLLEREIDVASSVSRGKQLETSGGGLNQPVLQADPVQLEIFNNHFAAIARQMGISLQMTSMSVNVKERLDFSCAIFTEVGDLVVNAPHIPVHLGAMSETVRGIIRLNHNVSPGDVFVTNDPFAGGSHLPDVTVVTPVFDENNAGLLLFWVASRSHHSEIGGISPGSMPANATNLAEEGVLIRNFKLVDGESGDERFDELHSLLDLPPYPSRSPRENLADIRAQVAANRTGQRDLLSLVGRYSKEVVLAYTGFIQKAAERKIRSAISNMREGCFKFEDAMDNGATIRVEVEKQGDELSIDFSGTDLVLKGNLNANPAIVASAVIYVMRCLIDEDIPLNEGVMNPVSINLPECFLNPASFDDPSLCPAVVGGNVETSQRIVDVLLGALQQAAPESEISAASQGTMNNWLMGDSTFGYYETVGGGAGATPSQDGAHAVHTHMTNTRLTDPEVLETRYPAVLREFSIRNHSGGAGFRTGGNGMVREVEFLKPLTVSLLTNRRNNAPYGSDGGAQGKPGRNLLIGRDGPEELPNSCEVQVDRGDRLRIETPGGGGWGK